MIDIGQPASDFALPDDSGTTRTLESLLADLPARLEANKIHADWSKADGSKDDAGLVLYFYPADFTPMCTAEACMFRDAHAELAGQGSRVVGISPQSVESHAKFRAKHGLPFPLLSDPQKSVIKAYGANGPLGIGTRRVTYLIGPNGVVLDRVESNLGLGKHKGFISRAVAGELDSRVD
jgi:peroxiredoxin Q/BCP